MLPRRDPDRRPIDRPDSTFNGSRHSSLDCWAGKRPRSSCRRSPAATATAWGAAPTTWTAWPVVIFLRILGRALCRPRLFRSLSVMLGSWCAAVPLADGL